ncbi:hypothetical protein [Crateriforma spongiae]|uniref:hypothetical protein n=1 Tax=Crateriforma spongiae TaxID=2724528 RepID=UPI0039B07F28
MNRTLIFIASVVAPTVARAADISTTYAFSPDLALEGNPVMAESGFAGIIGVNILVILAVSLMCGFWWLKPTALKLPSNANDLWAFASINYFGNEYSKTLFLYRFLTKFPTNWRLAIQLTGLAGSAVLVVGSCMAVFSWFAVHDWNLLWYKKAYFRTQFLFPYALLLPLFVVASVMFFKAEHTRTLSQQSCE